MSVLGGVLVVLLLGLSIVGVILYRRCVKASAPIGVCGATLNTAALERAAKQADNQC